MGFSHGQVWRCGTTWFDGLVGVFCEKMKSVVFEM